MEESISEISMKVIDVALNQVEKICETAFDYEELEELENTFDVTKNVTLEPTDIHQKNIDKMTLELLVNKRQYRKYLEKCDPVEYDKKQEEYDLICKYKYDIGTLFRDLLNDYSISGNSIHLGNSEIHHIFEAFLQKSAYYFETKEHDVRDCVSPIDEYIDENTMFEHIVEPSTASDESRPEYFANRYTAPFVNQFRDGNSFWGKNITKRK
jgi:hypothetical protein